MKTKILSFVLLVVVSVMGSFAIANESVNNTKYDESGRPLEIETLIKNKKTQNLTPVKKICFTYDAKGNCLEKVLYKWDHKNNLWLETTKTASKFDTNGKALKITNSTWNKKKQEWKMNSEWDSDKK